MHIRDVLADVVDSKRITAGDVTKLRRAIYHDGAAEAGEVEKLFKIDETATERDPAWPPLFIEAVVDYLVEQVEPHGYVSEANADWLIDRSGRDGVVKTATELELLVKVLERAKSSPERPVGFALHQVKEAVVDGKGPLVSGHHLTPGHIGRPEVELVRRILYAFGGDGKVAITHAEAEALFDINDHTVEAENDPAWTDLFVKAIANFMMAASGYAVPTRQQALHREEWLDSSSGGVGDFFSRMAAGGLRGIIAAYKRPGTEEVWAERNAEKRAAIASAEVVTAGEAEWLAQRIGRDGVLHDNEKALLRFIHDEAPSVHPSLKSLIAKAA
jgi:hypothetical protein